MPFPSPAASRRARIAAAALALLAASAGVAQAQQVISGSVRWAPTDSTLLPVRFAAVHVIDAEHEIVLDTARTDAAGAYRVTLSWPRVDTVLVAVRTESPYANVVDPVTGRTHEARSTREAVLRTGEPLELTLVVPWAQDPVNPAFSVMSSIEYGAAFRREMMGAAPARLDVEFPTADTKAGFERGRMYVPQANARDWDVVLHEYGHYVARLDGMTDSLGGPHLLDEPVAGEKKDALRLAWAEGWATWFSITAQREAALAKLGIARVGDTAYEDGTEPAMDPVHLDQPSPPWSQGELSEVAVARVVYDLADENDAKQQETVQLGPRRIWGLLQPGRPESLWTAWKLLSAALSPEERISAAGILESHSVAPVLDIPTPGAQLRGERPKFRWIGKSMASYLVTVFGPGNTVLLRIRTTDTSLRPTTDAWRRVREGARGGPVWWQVEGTPAESPPTGPYTSSRRTLVP